MKRTFALVLMAAAGFTACDKSPAGAGSGAAANLNDPVERKLAEAAGAGATNCGHLKSQVPAELDAASKCVMQNAQQKKPFFIAYDLPGLTVALAGNSSGKLFSIQNQSAASGGLSAVPCPSELRVAPSGRVTCYAPGTFPMGASSDLHGPLTDMPPGTNPHQRAPASGNGAPNPHEPPKNP